MDANVFEVTARLTVRDGQLDEFKRQVGEVMRAAREQDTRTLRYDVFLSDDGRHCEVHEAYIDADAFVEHQQHTAETRTRLLQEFVSEHKVSFYGEPSPMLIRMLAQMPEGMAAGIDRYSFFQGLETDVDIPA